MAGSEDLIVELNIGGVYYTTTINTLCHESNSLFSQMFESKSQVKDSKNRIFIDRDGLLFRYVLDYLRNRQLILPENFSEKKRLKCEAEFFRLPNMLKLIGDSDTINGHAINAVNLKMERLISSAPAGGRKKFSNGCIIVGYRGTFSNGRDGLNDVKFRKISRILISGRVQLCREVFGDTLNESRDPDHGVSDRYTSRFFLKHTFLEQAFDTLIECNFRLECVGATGANPFYDKDNKALIDNEENKWLHYNEFVFVRD
ncbi:BTB POZ domain-containing KCTD16 [Brachionus plicatilis]|uniref:BTB POZ domain-containing KCTD16 n=1 Tax=Brachionus plicatilis TaxID=10195 RepID=A0A3M7QUG2_BRAPC|nr:BTB POZ domain-containing KCTD16 [Brachionus plicatilis]